MEINTVDWAWGGKKSSSATKTTGKAQASAALGSSASCGPRDHSADTPLHPPLLASRALPQWGGGLISSPVSPFPHFTVSYASVILSTSTATGPYCWQKPPSKTRGTLLSYPKENRGSDCQRNMSKATERAVRGRIVSLLNLIPIYCGGMKVAVTATLYTSSRSLQPASLPWQRQNELIKCLPLAYFGNLMECVRV